jgi:hypothetical protein
MAEPSSHSQTGESEFKMRLEDDLRQCLRTESCPEPPEFCMVRDKDRIGPCIIVVCWDNNNCMGREEREITQKKLQKKIPKLQSMRNCPFPCKVIVDRLRFLALAPSLPTIAAASSEMESLPDLGICEDPVFVPKHINRRKSSTVGRNPPAHHNIDMVSIQAQVAETQATFVSLSIRNAVEEGRACTLGGLISVGDKVYGLTVAHPFKQFEVNDEVRKATFPCLTPKSETSEESDSDKSLFDEFTSDRMGMFVDNTGRGQPDFSPQSGRVSTAKDLVLPAEVCSSVKGRNLDSEVFSNFGTIFASSFDLKLSNSSIEPTVQYDWALIDMNRQFLPLQNSYISPGSSNAVDIRSISREKPNPGLEVLVLGGRSGIHEGKVDQGSVRINVRGHEYVLTRLVLTKPLGEYMLIE